MMSRPHQYIAVIVGFRHKSPDIVGREIDLSQLTAHPDVIFLRRLIGDLKQEYGESLTVVSLTANRGFGLLVRVMCRELEVGFAEFVTFFNEHVAKGLEQALLLARHGALLDLAQTSSQTQIAYHLFVSKGRVSDIEDLVYRLENGAPSEHTAYTVYSFDNAIIGGTHVKAK